MGHACSNAANLQNPFLKCGLLHTINNSSAIDVEQCTTVQRTCTVERCPPGMEDTRFVVDCCMRMATACSIRDGFFAWTETESMLLRDATQGSVG